MVKQMKTLAIMGLSIAMAFSGMVPAQAFQSIPGPKLPGADFQLVGHGWHHHGGGHGWHGGGHGWHGNWHGSNGWHGNHGWHHGHCCHGDDFDNFDGFFGGLAAGAIVGGLIAQPYYGYYDSSDWCYAHYRSYRCRARYY